MRLRFLEALDTGGRCASLVGGMPGTKGKPKEGQKWSNWIRNLVNGLNETHCNELDRPKMADIRLLVVQASAKLQEDVCVRCLRKVVAEIRRGFWSSRSVTVAGSGSESDE